MSNDWWDSKNRSIRIEGVVIDLFFFLIMQGLVEIVKSIEPSTNTFIQSIIGASLIIIIIVMAKYTNIKLIKWPYIKLKYYAIKKFKGNTLINESYDKKTNKPLIVYKKDLSCKFFWPDWAFNIIMLARKPRITLDGEKIQLSIDIKDTEIGVYNNDGKNRYRERIVSAKKKNNFFAESERTMKFQMNEAREKNSHSVNIDDLRWTSGGALPIVNWRDKQWVCTFFRDIYPIGLNIANGASESYGEQINPRTLTFREFSEEFVVLNRNPAECKTKCLQRTFILDTPNSDKLESKKFNRKHRKLRKRDDNQGIKTDKEKEHYITLNPRSIGSSVRIETDSKKKSSEVVHDVIFTINPLELGVELIKIFDTEIEENDYIIDGEIHENKEWLIRRPVVLLSYKFLKKQWDENKSLGSLEKEHPYMECKRLKMIPSDCYHIFNADTELRANRVEIISKKLEQLQQKKLNKKKKLYKREKLNEELNFHKKWLDKYEKMFNRFSKSNPELVGDEYMELLTLCPVTWKTIELLFTYGDELK